MRGEKHRGFTLIELVFVILLLAIFSSVAIPTLSNILRMNLRRGATEVSGYLRTAYEWSVMRKERVRVRFDLESGKYWAEVYRGADTIPLLDADSDIPEIIRQFEDRTDNEFLTDEEKLEAKQKAYEKLEASSLRPSRLPDKVHFKGLYAPNQEDVITEGSPWVEFSPGGFAQEASVYLTNNMKDMYSVIVRPLGGKAQVEKGEVRPSDV